MFKYICQHLPIRYQFLFEAGHVEIVYQLSIQWFPSLVLVLTGARKWAKWGPSGVVAQFQLCDIHMTRDLLDRYVHTIQTSWRASTLPCMHRYHQILTYQLQTQAEMLDMIYWYTVLAYLQAHSTFLLAGCTIQAATSWPDPVMTWVLHD